jgi:glycosyltransferase involved in cell wall biosynthesis
MQCELIAATSDSASACVARVVIPAFRATRTIRKCVSSLLNSEFEGDFEIIVVDDGENNNLRDQLVGLPVTIIRALSGSAAVARNRGAQGCAAPYLVFVDADVLIEPSCLQRLIAPLRSGQAHATVGNYSRNVQGMSFGGRYKQLYIACVNKRRRTCLHTFWTAIGAVDARCFDEVGGFDIAFKGANGEDAELGLRLSRKGYRILPVSDALGQHRHDLTFRQLVLNDWRKGLGAMRHYYRNRGAMSDNCHATNRDKISVTLAVVILISTLTPFAGTSFLATLLAMLASTIIYIGARSDILQSFWPQGLRFMIVALLVMLLLDLLRCVCVAIGVCRARLSRIAPFTRPVGAEKNSRDGVLN